MILTICIPISHRIHQDRIRASASRGRWLTTRTMAQTFTYIHTDTHTHTHIHTHTHTYMHFVNTSYSLSGYGMWKKVIWHCTWPIWSQLSICWHDKSSTYFLETNKKIIFILIRSIFSALICIRCTRTNKMQLIPVMSYYCDIFTVCWSFHWFSFWQILAGSLSIFIVKISQ